MAFAYILLTVIVALTIPLALNLAKRTRSEIESDTKIDALTIAAQIGSEGLKAGPALDRAILDYALQVDGRVVVMNADGRVLSDSDGTAVGEFFNNGKRPEVSAALDPANPVPYATSRYSQTDQADLLVASAPILDEGLAGAVRITRNVQFVSDSIREATVGLIVVGAAGLLAGLLIAFGLAGSFARPLTRLARTAERLGEGDLSARAGNVGGAEEIEDLARTFDEMADRMQRTVQAQREFVANASHQLRTPLTGMKLRLESAHARTEDPDLRAQLEAADMESDRLSETVDRMLVMSKRIEQGDPTHVDLADAATRAEARWRERAAAKQVAIHAIGVPAVGQGNPADLDQALDNLIDNALSYGAGPLELETHGEAGQAVLAVRDHGPGIPAGEQQRVTERFYRGKTAPSGGSGLGLAIARDLTERWGGSLLVRDADGGGARIEIRLRATDVGA
ncbi:MAG: HAMP domain-containing sensor histidine kinase [Actinomycetota bacterium]